SERRRMRAASARGREDDGEQRQMVFHRTRRLRLSAIARSAAEFTLKKISSGSPQGEASTRTVVTSPCQPPARRSPDSRWRSTAARHDARYQAHRGSNPSGELLTGTAAAASAFSPAARRARIRPPGTNGAYHENTSNVR